jgi:hypothetical protein
VADINEVLGQLTQAQENAERGQQLVAAAKDGLDQIAQQLSGLGIQDRATITLAAAQSTANAMGALAQAIQAVGEAAAATQQASGAGN